MIFNGFDDRRAFFRLETGGVAIGANYGTLRPRRIAPIHRIVIYVFVKVEIVFAADGVSLKEPPKNRVVHPRLIIIELGFRKNGLAGLTEATAGGHIVRP